MYISVCFNKHVSSTLIYKTGNFVWFPVVWKDSRELWALVVIAASGIYQELIPLLYELFMVYIRAKAIKHWIDTFQYIGYTFTKPIS